MLSCISLINISEIMTRDVRNNQQKCSGYSNLCTWSTQCAYSVSSPFKSSTMAMPIAWPTFM